MLKFIGLILAAIPFFIAAGGPGGSYGILLDNTWRSWFDFGKQDPQTVAFGSAAGPIDYYLIYGPSVHHVVERYTLTDADHINYEATIEDAKTFTRPWKLSTVLYKHTEKNFQLLEFKCVEFSEQLIYGQYKKK